MVMPDQKEFASLLSSYNDHKALEREFAEQLGYFNRQEIPDHLVNKIADFCDTHPDDVMTSFYACSLINKFFRRRTRQRWAKLFAAMDAQLKNKRFLIDMFVGYRIDAEKLGWIGAVSVDSIWQAIDAFEDGYGKANLIGRFSYLFVDEILQQAYERAQSMPDAFKIRALAGIYPRMNAAVKNDIFSYLFKEFIGGSYEATFQLRRLFSCLETNSRDEVVSAYLSRHDLPVRDLSLFIIHNVDHLSAEDAQRFVPKARQLQSDYLRNRCLLKLNRYLPEGELDVLYQGFIENFTTQPPNSELIHNLYHFSAVRKDLDKDTVVDMVLNKIASLDDSQNAIYNQQRYAELSFLVPQLTREHMSKAFAIAESVRGGYRKNLVSRLKRHFGNLSELGVGLGS